MSSGSDQMPDILIRDHTAADQPAGRKGGAHRPSPVDLRRPVHRPRRSRERLRDYLTTPERIASWVAADLATPITAEFVIGAYHRLFEIEKSFCMSKTDLQARPIYHRTRDSIEAHLTIVFAALAVSRWMENQTGWSIRKFVRATRRYRTIEIRAGDHTITAADPLPDDLHDALSKISGTPRGAH